MTAILLVAAMLIWVAIAAWVSVFLTRRLANTVWRIPGAILAFAGLLPLPLIDEILAMPQMKRLCETNGDVIVDTKITQGRTVWFEASERKQLRLGLIDVTEVRRSYADVKTNEPVYHYFRFEAKAGWFIKLLGISEGSSPLLFDAVCQPADLGSIDRKLGLTRINRPT